MINVECGCMRQGLKRQLPFMKNITKANCKERPKEAPLRFLLLLFFMNGTISGKPV